MFSRSVWSRRRFLYQTAAACALTGVARLCQAEETAAVSFGFTLYGMRSLPVAKALQVCSQTGYDSVELACMTDWPLAPEKLSSTDRSEMRRLLGDSKLSVAGLMENVSPLVDDATHQANLDRLKRACELARDLTPTATPVIETVLGGRPAEWEQVRETMVKRLQDWAKLAESQQAIIALKPHVSGALHTPAGAIWLMDQLKSRWLRLAYDYSHFELRDLSLQKSLESMLPQTAFIHVKDTKGTAEQVQFLLPGEGRTDYGAYFRQLKSSHYRGPLVVEVSGQLHTKPSYDPVAAAMQSYAKLAPILKEAGLRQKS